MADKPSKSDSDAGIQITRAGYKWSASFGQPASVSFGFRGSKPGYEDTYTANGVSHPEGLQTTFAPLSEEQRFAVEIALALISDVANIDFYPGVDVYPPGVQVKPSPFTSNATILIGTYYNTSDGKGAYAYNPFSPADTAPSYKDGDVWLNSQYISATPVVGSYSFQAIMHELGHAVGLQHPGDYNAAPGVAITYANSATYREDDLQYTIMSYFQRRIPALISPGIILRLRC